MGDRRKCQTYAASPAEPGGLPVMLGQKNNRIYTGPNSLPVFRLMKCSLRQAGQATPSYSSSGAYSSSSSQCWTLIDVAGHLKIKEAMAAGS